MCTKRAGTTANASYVRVHCTLATSSHHVTPLLASFLLIAISAAVSVLSRDRNTSLGLSSTIVPRMTVKESASHKWPTFQQSTSGSICSYVDNPATGFLLVSPTPAITPPRRDHPFLTGSRDRVNYVLCFSTSAATGGCSSMCTHMDRQ